MAFKGEVSPLSERKNELLKLSRKSRRLWLYEGCDEATLKSLRGLVEMRVGISFGLKTHEIPGVKSLQSVLNYLSEICEDDFHLSVQSLLPTFEVDIDDDPDVSAEGTAVSPRESGDEYAVFIDRLCRSDVADIVRGMQHFVKKIRDGANTMSTSSSSSTAGTSADRHDHHRAKAKLIWEHIDSIALQMRAHDGWHAETDDAWGATLRCLERFVFGKVKDAIFGSTPEDDIADRHFSEHLALLGFIKPSHVGVAGSEDIAACLAPLSGAVHRLRTLEDLQCPSDMHESIRVIAADIGSLLQERGKAKSPPRPANTPTKSIDAAYGTDDFLPYLILCLREARPLRTKSVATFLEQYTRPHLLGAEPGYLLTQLASALQFLDTVDAAALNMDASLYLRAISEERAKAVSKMAVTRASVSSDIGGEEQQLLLPSSASSLSSLPPPPVVPPEHQRLAALRAQGPPSVHTVARKRAAGALHTYM